MKLIEDLCNSFKNTKRGHLRVEFRYYEEYDARIFYYDEIAILRVNDTVNTFKSHRNIFGKAKEAQNKIRLWLLKEDFLDVTEYTNTITNITM